uniref:Uncharacterized protein n=1 Tax=Cacopsylla melanoneura TaxID=428564 RepID=A0A8D8LNB3_9HEMI
MTVHCVPVIRYCFCDIHSLTAITFFTQSLFLLTSAGVLTSSSSSSSSPISIMIKSGHCVSVIRYCFCDIHSLTAITFFTQSLFLLTSAGVLTSSSSSPISIMSDNTFNTLR